MDARTLRPWMMLAVTMLCFLPPQSVHAANDCPWLNEATASGILGSDAVGTYTAATNGQAATCSFVAASADAKRTLFISVKFSVQAPHGMIVAMERTCLHGSTPLNATGNEAIVCRARGALLSEYVAGRVRDQVFAITLSTNRKDDPILADEMLRMHIAVAADQVSGNLF